MFLQKLLYKLKYGSTEPPMVRYWKTKEAVEAKVVKNKLGHYEMIMEGEDHPFPGYPRGSLLYGSLSPLKHLVKNKVFNETVDNPELLREKLDLVFKWAEEGKAEDEHSIEMRKIKFDLVPFEQLNPPIKELWRAMTVVEKKMGGRVGRLKEILCFILQEDDAYRMRFQWCAKFFGWAFKRNPVKSFDFALSMLEHAEIVGDMKEKQRLFRKVFQQAMKDERIKECFIMLCKELDWKKIKLTEGDKYFFRAKYFKVDYPEFTY